MGKLNIAIRKNVSKDDPLVFSTYVSPYITANYGQEAVSPYYRSKGYIDTLERRYIKPVLNISTTTDSIRRGLKDTSFIFKIDAHATIFHELTHYLQNSWVGDNYIEMSYENFQQHMHQPVEFEAYAVEAYYFLSIVNKKALNKILKNSSDRDSLFKSLYNEEHRILYPKDTILILR